jgi:mono/diheme cytochrome c family protein
MTKRSHNPHPAHIISVRDLDLDLGWAPRFRKSDNPPSAFKALRTEQHQMRRPKQQLALVWLPVFVLITNDASGAPAADAANGRRIAQMRCAPCHIVVPNQRKEIADSPPFEDIGRQNGFNAEMLAYLILAPHPRMNLTFTRKEVDDLAAYIASLQK